MHTILSLDIQSKTVPIKMKIPPRNNYIKIGKADPSLITHLTSTSVFLRTTLTLTPFATSSEDDDKKKFFFCQKIKSAFS
jgi:hypothetical protein